MVPRIACAVLLGLMLPQAARSQIVDLTGQWRDDTGTSYAVRQIGNTLYWSMDRRPQVHNVFHGTIIGTTITGTWADLPGGQLQNSGGLMLRIESNDRFVKIGEAAASTYGASVWTREGAGVAIPTSICNGFSGQWSTSYGAMTITVAGGRATGTYYGGAATLTGAVMGNVLEADWVQTDRPGHLHFELGSDGRSFSGRWTEANGSGGGSWNGTCTGGLGR